MLHSGYRYDSATILDIHSINISVLTFLVAAVIVGPCCNCLHFSVNNVGWTTGSMIFPPLAGCPRRKYTLCTRDILETACIGHRCVYKLACIIELCSSLGPVSFDLHKFCRHVICRQCAQSARSASEVNDVHKDNKTKHYYRVDPL